MKRAGRPFTLYSATNLVSIWTNPVSRSNSSRKAPPRHSSPSPRGRGPGEGEPYSEVVSFHCLLRVLFSSHSYCGSWPHRRHAPLRYMELTMPVRWLTNRDLFLKIFRRRASGSSNSSQKLTKETKD